MAIQIQEQLAVLEERILDVRSKIAALTDELNFLTQARNLFAHPKFAELMNGRVTEGQSSVPTPAAYASAESQSSESLGHIKVGNFPVPIGKGSLKNYAYQCLPSKGPGMTPQDLAKEMQERGFVFKSKTPSISVNEALQTLREQRQARIYGRTSNGGNLWIKDISQSSNGLPSFLERGEEKEATEAAS